MRISYFWLPLLVIVSLFLLSACSDSDWMNSKRTYEPRLWVSGSWKYNSGSYRRWDREKSNIQSNFSDTQKQNINTSISWSMVVPSSSVITTVATDTTQNIQKTVSYNTPWELVNITFSILLDANKNITAVNAIMNSGERESQQYVRKFTKNIWQYAIGKKINSLSLSAIGGASLTTWAFNQVIQAL